MVEPSEQSSFDFLALKNEFSFLSEQLILSVYYNNANQDYNAAKQILSQF
jgi:hypothetical protein